MYQFKLWKVLHSCSRKNDTSTSYANLILLYMSPNPIFFFYNLSRLERIRELQIFLKADLEFEEESNEHVKNRSHMYVIFR